MDKKTIKSVFRVLSEGDDCYLCEIVVGPERGSTIRITKACPEYTSAHYRVLENLQIEPTAATIEKDDNRWRLKTSTINEGQ